MLSAVCFLLGSPSQAALPPQFRIDRGFGGFAFDVVGQYVDKKGVKYQLGKCRVLGSYRDLWIKKMSEMPEFAFTGAGGQHLATSLTPSFHPDSSGIRATQAKIYGDYVAKGWHKDAERFSELVLDSDRDGLTDIVEARLDTNNLIADTDGDGISDSSDAMPNAPQRPLSEAETVIGLAVSYLREREGHTGFDIFEAPSRMRPFQMNVASGYLLWRAEEDVTYPLFRLSFGLEIIKDLLPVESRKVEDMKKPWEDQYVIWDENGTRAQVGVRGSFFGVTVHLRKLGVSWFVYDVKDRWIS